MKTRRQTIRRLWPLVAVLLLACSGMDQDDPNEGPGGPTITPSVTGGGSPTVIAGPRLNGSRQLAVQGLQPVTPGSLTPVEPTTPGGNPPPQNPPPQNPPQNPPPVDGDDSDGDGLSDATERAGWTIYIDSTGFARAGTISGTTEHLEERHVTSDPELRDTDGDGLEDGEERTASSDPRERDTDGDGLGDAEEWLLYRSYPNAVDSDGDSRGPEGTAPPNPRLFDGAEVAVYSSPQLVDTDADGLSDYHEIADGGSHPAIADLPAIAIDVLGPPNVSLNATESADRTRSLSGTSATLRGSSNSYSRSDSRSREAAFSHSRRTEGSVGVGLDGLFSASISHSTESTRSISGSRTHSTSRESSRFAQRSYEEAVSEESAVSLSYSDGTLRVELGIANESPAIALRVESLALQVKRYDSATGQMLLVDELAPALDDMWNLDPNGGSISVMFENESVGADDIKAILADPRMLSFEIARYSMYRIDRFGNRTFDYAALNQEMQRQCSELIVDFGEGRLESYTVATNLYRDDNGLSSGLTLDEIVELTGLHAAIETREVDGQQVLWRVDDQENYIDETDPARRGHWVVVSDQPAADFGAIVVRPGSEVILAWVEDNDGDGLYNREEALLETEPNDVDSDDDGLCDGRVTRDACVGSEGAAGTDPIDPDSDGDLLDDGFDAAPLVFDPGVVPTEGLHRHWIIDGPRSHHGVTDLAGRYDAQMWCRDAGNSGYDGITLDADRFGDTEGAWGYDGSLACSVSSQANLGDGFTLAIWLRSQPDQPVRGFVSGKPARAALFVDDDGTGDLIFRLGHPKDIYFDEIRTPAADLFDDWTLVVATVDPDGHAQLFVNGVLAGALQLDHTPWSYDGSPVVDNRQNSYFSVVGRQDDHEYWTIEGLQDIVPTPRLTAQFDDIRVFDHALDAEAVRGLYFEDRVRPW